MSLNIEELEIRLRQEMDEKVGAFDKQLRMMQQEYQHNADGARKWQQQAEQDFDEVKYRREASERETAREQTILDRERDEIKIIKNEFQQQREQQEHEMGRMVQQMSEIAWRVE